MKKFANVFLITGSLLILNNCNNEDDDDDNIVPPDQGQQPIGLTDGLPKPDVTHEAKTVSKVLGWPTDKKPVAGISPRLFVKTTRDNSC